MLEFLNPLLLGGLAAVSAPVIIHLLHRRRVKVVDWGAMRFLVELLAKSRRRLFLDEVLLLLVRALLIACLALAMVRPAWRRTSASSPAAGIQRAGRAAAVLLIDDSVSAMAGRAQPAFDAMKQLALAYVGSLAPGDEVSVLPMSRLGAEPGDPGFDLEAVKAGLGNLKPTCVATDIPRLLDAGLNQLKRHVNPGAELVLVTDGRKDGWHTEDPVRWAELRQRLRGPPKAVVGSRERPQVIVLAPSVADLEDNLGIVGLSMDRTLVSAGKPAGAVVDVANSDRQAARETTVQLAIDGQVVDTKRVQVPAGGRQETTFACRFPAPGSYALEATLVDQHDLLPADDRRALSIQVEPPLSVLLVEDGATPGLDSKLGFLMTALNPERDDRSAFNVTRLPVTQFNPASLADYRVVVLGDVSLLDPGSIDALERFVVGGGGVLVGLGPGSNPDFINRYWARGGEGFLPCPLDRVVTPEKPALPAVINFGHPAFRGFAARDDEAWKAAKVKSYFKLATQKVAAADLDVLLKLDNGDPLVVERRRGLGLVALVATSLNADWSDLPLQAAYVPLVRGVVGHLGNFIVPPRNLRPGEPIIYARIANPAQTLRGEDPHGNPLKLTLGAWEGRDAIVSEPLLEPGVYTLRPTGTENPIRFAVAVSPAESALAAVNDREMAQALAGELRVFHSPEQVTENLDPARRASVELWRWLLLGGALLMFVEAWLTRREAVAASPNRD